MAPTEKDKDKIRKLLALSESNNANEAAVALQRARDMLMKFNMSMSELEIKSSIEEEILDEGKSEHPHETILMGQIARYNLCETYRKHRYFYDYKGRRHSTIKRMIVGSDSNIASTKVMIEFVMEVMEKGAARLKGTGRIEVASYKKAFCLTLANRVAQMIVEAQKTDTPECKDLVVVTNAEVQQIMKQKNLVEGKSIDGTIKGNIGGLKGMMDANKVNLNPQLGMKPRQDMRAIG